MPSVPPPRDYSGEAVPPRGLELPFPGDTPAPPPPSRAPPPRPAGGLTQHDKDYWDEVDRLFTATVRRAETAFKATLWINIVIVAVGVALIGSSIAYSWVRGVDVLSAGLAAIGVADFVAVFFVGPQNYINQGVRSLTRVQIVYRSYLLEIESISDYDWAAEHSGPRMLEDVTKTVSEWQDVTTKSLQQLDSDPGISPIKTGTGSGSSPPSQPSPGAPAQPSTPPGKS
jgi:hypothetical protein